MFKKKKKRQKELIYMRASVKERTNEPKERTKEEQKMEKKTHPHLLACQVNMIK